jgi:histidinol-phosphate/aromatic aminotransferase/cobyric acid decarboxylase-like protein
MAFASEEIIEIFNKVKPPYNINEASQELALEALQNVDQINNWIKETVAEREKLIAELAQILVCPENLSLRCEFHSCENQQSKRYLRPPRQFGDHCSRPLKS